MFLFLSKELFRTPIPQFFWTAIPVVIIIPTPITKDYDDDNDRRKANDEAEYATQHKQPSKSLISLSTVKQKRDLQQRWHL